MNAPAERPLDVLVIGAGQVGLALGHHLARHAQRFLIVDAGADIGAVWRSRWDSLVLFTPAQYDNLPGLPFPAAKDTYPGKDQVADYLQRYTAAFALPVRLKHDGDLAEPKRRGYRSPLGGIACRCGVSLRRPRPS